MKLTVTEITLYFGFNIYLSVISNRWHSGKKGLLKKLLNTECSRENNHSSHTISEEKMIKKKHFEISALINLNVKVLKYLFTYLFIFLIWLFHYLQCLWIKIFLKSKLDHVRHISIIFFSHRVLLKVHLFLFFFLRMISVQLKNDRHLRHKNFRAV